MGDDPAGWRLERRAATTHGEIAWDVFGHGPPVVLVHGTPSRSVLWRNIVPVLAERFTVYAFDLLGSASPSVRRPRSFRFACTGRCLPNCSGFGTSNRLL
jgi:pimeloyl-ACP methyl ester carboxylesterase